MEQSITSLRMWALYQLVTRLLQVHLNIIIDGAGSIPGFTDHNML